LVEHLPKPGLDLRRAFGFVRDDVLKNTGNKQEPYVYGSLGGNDLPLVPAKPVATGPQADPQASVRRDYELALQAGVRGAWEAFLRTYPTGFYADLANVQLKKISAEDARAAAAEKARQAELEKTRLTAEGAKKAEQDKAAKAAKVAEDARLAAERAKQVETEKAAAAERTRLAEQEKAAAAEKVAAEKKEQVAALAPQPSKSDQATATDLPRSLQAELRRVGCNTGAVDGNWNAASQRALDLFNKHAGLKLDVKAASADALDAVKGKTTRVCPLVCDHGFRADGDLCSKITCGAGYAVGDDNTCEKIEVKKPVAKRDEPKRERQQRARTEAAPAKPQVSGQIICNAVGCKPLRPGCRVGSVVLGGGTSGAHATEVCN
jgi:hypothetical protein